MATKTKITVTNSDQRAERVDSDDPNEPVVGRWFWLKHEDEEHLVCAVHIGSNYVEVDGPTVRSQRIHATEWDAQLRPEPNAREVIASKISGLQRRVGQLLVQVHDLTRALGIASGPRQLQETTSTGSFLSVASSKPVNEYKAALTLAKDTTLPALFDKIEETNEALSDWMSSDLIPLKAQAAGLDELTESIEGRIFNVELYAGLVENVQKIKDGKPAPMKEKIRIFQARAYMDEECLIDYRTGGMEFKKIDEFDAWLCEPKNLNRILPFPRCIMAFQVRRNHKDRSEVPLRRFIQMLFDGTVASDKLTFLYLRNGDQVYRLETEIEFGESLFPDPERQKLLTGQIYATDRGDSLISQGAYEAMVEEEKREEAALEAKYQAELAEYEKIRPEAEAYNAAVEKWREECKRYVKARRAAEERIFDERSTRRSDGSRSYSGPDPTEEEIGMVEPERPEKKDFPPAPWKRHVFPKSTFYSPWNKSNIHYDDIAKAVKKTIDEHNRLVLVLQGLLDRSPAMHPHPPWKLWDAKDFAEAFDLIFDVDRALSPGEAPDFEAYRAKLNASLAPGSVTIGQEDAWMRLEAERENARRERRWRQGEDRDLVRYRPYGNPGPGHVARVERMTSKGAVFKWNRNRQGSLSYWDRHRGKTSQIACSVTVPRNQLLNVSAYKPGDFKQFFEDPRTRADYLQWAPLLLTAEEFHAGNIKLGGSDDE